MRDKRRENLLISGIVLLLILSLMFSTSYADVPRTINYQGYLTNDAGSPVDGTVDITFSIYDAVTEGTDQWVESHLGVSVSNGIFSVILGKTIPITASCLASGNCWLGVSVGGDPEMSPRQKLTGAAYSIRAGVAESALSAESTDNVSIGTSTTYVGANAGNPTSTGYDNTFIGSLAGDSNTSGDNNTFIGSGSGKFNTEGDYNTFLGRYSGNFNSTGNSNTFLGYMAGSANQTGNYNTYIGKNAGEHTTSGSGNTSIGLLAGGELTTGSENIFMGAAAGQNNTEGIGNVFLGSWSGYYNVLGSGNVFLGYRVGYDELGSNKLYIDNSDTSAPLIWGDFENDKLGINGNVGIGTNDPGDTRLMVAGNVHIDGTTTPGVADEVLLTAWNHGDGIGAHFEAEGAQARAIRAWATNTEPGAANIGGDFSARGESGIGVWGSADTGADGVGVQGIAGGINARGVAGFARDTTGAGESYGGWFRAESLNGKGVYGKNMDEPTLTTVTQGYLGGGERGAYGEHGSTGNYGYLGSVDYGVYSGGDSYVEGNLTAEGIIESTTGGFKFPDGTTQTTSAGTGGILGYERVSYSEGVTISHGGSISRSVNCSAGKKVLGGGLSGGGLVAQSYPSSDSQWAGTFYNPNLDPEFGTISFTATVWAICASAP